MGDLSETFRRKTVLVTGGAGSIGTNLVNALASFDVKGITILDNLSSAYEWSIPRGPKIHFLHGDVSRDADLRRAFKERPQVVYHLAAHFANQNSVDHPELDLQVNGLGTLKVLEHAHLVGVDRFIYASSGCGIYGPDTPMPFTEEYVSTKLYTPYQVTKMLGELYTSMFQSLYDLPVVNPRFFNSYGPGEVPGKYRNVIPNFFYWAMKEETLPITGTGEETRDFAYVGDIVSGLLACAHYEEAVGEAINLATGREIRIADLAQWVNDLTGNQGGIKFIERRNWDKKHRLLASIDKARRILKYEPKMEFKNGLREVHAWFKKNWENISKSADF